MQEHPHLDQLISLLVGPFATWLISYIKGRTWTTKQRFIVAVAVSLFLGMLTAYVTNDLVLSQGMTWDDWIGNGLTVFLSATATYKLWFENTKTEDELKRKGPFE